VEPIPVEPGTSASGAPGTHEPAEIEMPADESPRKEISPKEHRPPAAPVAQTGHRARDLQHRVQKEPRPSPPAPPPFTRDLLSQKFRQVRREYDDYKANFGSRLEREWGELATYIQFMPANTDDAGRREAARRIDVFRGRMRE
jgi:hypothetical protein